MFRCAIFVLCLCSIGNGLPTVNRSLSSIIRIVGGQDADIATYPYQVSIMIDSQHACGGSILSNSFILTAAHCFADESRVAYITVRVGSSLRTSGGQVVPVKTINSHSSFNLDTFDNDVAVIELASPLVYATGIQPISLPTATTTFTDGQASIATGWGLTSNDGDLATTLQVVTVPLITTATCQAGFYGSSITANMICAGEAGRDSCTGDSGGPLVTNGVQIGIVSWGDVCGQASTPGVYTKVTQYISYINGIIGSST